MSIKSVTHQFVATQYQSFKPKQKDQGVKQSASKGKSEEAVKIIAENKTAANKPLDEKEIQRRKEMREYLCTQDPAQALGGAINPERLAAEKEKSAKFVPIQNKMLSGQRLSPQEKAFLKKEYPELYAKAMQIEQEIDDFKKRIQSCKSKEEANDIYLAKKLQLLNSAGKDGGALFMSAALDRAYLSM